MVLEMSKTYQYRKVMKPLLERKRRARINKCLDALKNLIVECLTQEGEHITRLEKADILELTVEYMRKLKQGIKDPSSVLSSSSSSSSPLSDCFRSGYIHAADQISKILATTPCVDLDLGTKLMSYLGTRLNQIQNINDVDPKMRFTKSENKSNKSPILYSIVNECSPDCKMIPANSIRPNQIQLVGADAKDGNLESNVWRPW